MDPNDSKEARDAHFQSTKEIVHVRKTIMWLEGLSVLKPLVDCLHRIVTEPEKRLFAASDGDANAMFFDKTIFPSIEPVSLSACGRRAAAKGGI